MFLQFKNIMVYIYILELEQHKYYVGKTNHPGLRLDNHFEGSGSVWTKKYKPIRILEMIPNCDNFDEDKYTIQYMEKYGINNVRGGSFCQIKLTDSNIETLQQIIKSVTNNCYICGNPGHYAKECARRAVSLVLPSPDKKCDCPTSFFSSHRKSKCFLNNILTIFEDEDDDIEKLKTI